MPSVARTGNENRDLERQRHSRAAGQLLDWLAAEKPDIVCLQEIKASLDQLPFELRDIEDYWSYWHGEKGYSGVALLVAKSLAGALPVCSHPGIRLRAAHRLRARCPRPPAT